MQIPDMYALEHLSDEEFWDLAFTKAFSAAPTRTPFAHLSPDTHSLSPGQQEVSPETSIVCDDTYAFPLNALYEIIPVPQHIAFLPDTPSWMMGLIAWRGRVLATIDLHAYLHDTISNRGEQQDADVNQSRDVNQGVIELRPYDMLLIAHHDDVFLAFAATVSTIGQADTFSGPDSPDPTNTAHSSYTFLDMPALFEDIVKRLEKTASHE